MSKIAIMPAPSPRGTNHERLYLVRMPRSTPLGALDQAIKSLKLSDDDRGLHELHRKLEELVTSCLSDEGAQSAALEMLDSAFGGQRYGEDDVEEPAGRQRMRTFLHDKGIADADIDELFEQMDGEQDEMPRNGLTEPEARDRRRSARDRRQAMDSATSGFDLMFPGAGRIKQAV